MIVLCTLWGFNQVWVKIANAGISPILQCGLRSLGAAALLWLWAAARGITMFQRDGTLRLGVAAGLMFGVEFAMIYVGMEYTTVSRSVIFLYTAPFAVAVGSHLFVPNERMRPVQVAGLLAAFGGVVVAVAEGLSFPSGHAFFGDMLMLGAGFIWGATTVMIKASKLIRIAPSRTLFYQLLVSGLFLPPASYILGEPGIIALTAPVVASVAFQIVVVAFASYLAWFWLVQHYPANRLAAFTFLSPLVGMVAGPLMLGERITPLLALAAALVAVGIYLVNRPPPPRLA
jgi:drug/metabolite transporter (DMT)-like permease